METVYYVKEGRKYKPVSYYDSSVLDSVPEGATLIVKQKGCRMQRSKIETAYAPFLAAMLSVEPAVSSGIVKASEAYPHSSRPLTESQHADWTKFIKKHGEAFRYLAYPSARDIAESAMAELKKHVDKAHSNPAVQEAWEHYKFLVALSLSEDTK